MQCWNKEGKGKEANRVKSFVLLFLSELFADDNLSLSVCINYVQMGNGRSTSGQLLSSQRRGKPIQCSERMIQHAAGMSPSHQVSSCIEEELFALYLLSYSGQHIFKNRSIIRP